MPVGQGSGPTPLVAFPLILHGLNVDLVPVPPGRELPDHDGYSRVFVGPDGWRLAMLSWGLEEESIATVNRIITRSRHRGPLTADELDEMEADSLGVPRKGGAA